MLLYQAFDTFNPESDVQRCPYGMSSVRDELDTYVYAALNLYGLIKLDDLLDIYNLHHDREIDRKLAYTLLLPLIRKKRHYMFYHEYIVDPVNPALMDIEEAEDLIMRHQKYERYIPGPLEFVKFADSQYTDNPYKEKMADFVCKEFKVSRAFAEFFTSELITVLHRDDFLQGAQQLLSTHDLVFNSEKSVKKFIDMLMELTNHERMYLLNGNRPSDIRDMKEFNQEEHEPKVMQETPPTAYDRVGRNDPCPCGSGRKFKRCCQPYISSPDACLSETDANLFYELFLLLMNYVNGQLFPGAASIVEEDIFNENSKHVFHLRDHLWNKPEMIKDFLESAQLQKENKDILESWYEHFQKGVFVVARYTPEGALCLNEQSELLLVKGVRKQLGESVGAPPKTMEAVLLPFREHIIVDCYLNLYPIVYGEGARAMIEENFVKALERGVRKSF